MLKKENCSLCRKRNQFKLKYVLPKFNIVECENCGLLTRDLIFPRKEIEKLYAKDYFCKLQKKYFSAGVSQELEKSLRVKDFRERLKKIGKYSSLSLGKLLDIGAGTGVFLKIAKEANWSTYGVEISQFAANFARKKFKLNIFCGELKEAKYRSNYFDIVTGWDLIEHVEDPSDLVGEIYRLLKPNGYIVLQTTMVDSLLFIAADIIYKLSFGKIRKLAEVAYPVHHANHFSRKTLKSLVNKYGFKIIRTENVEMFYEETSLPKIFIPFLKILGYFSIITGKTIENFIIAQKK